MVDIVKAICYLILIVGVIAWVTITIIQSNHCADDLCKNLGYDEYLLGQCISENYYKDVRIIYSGFFSQECKLLEDAD